MPSHSLENKRTARPSEVSALNGRVPSIVASHIAGPFTRRADSQREANSVIADIPLVAHRYRSSFNTSTIICLNNLCMST